MTLMSDRGCASASAACASTARSRPQILEAVSDRAIEAAMLAADQSARATATIRQAVARELEEARYEAALAARRYELVDPAKRHVARELEARWNAALERVAAAGASSRRS